MSCDLQVIWEYYDGGLWNALPDEDSYHIEGKYCDSVNTFQLEDTHVAFTYNLHNMTRMHLRTRAVHRIKRTPFIEERPEGTYICSVSSVLLLGG